MVMRGGKPTSRLSAELAEEYQHYLPDAQSVVFEDSGHRLWVPDMQRFVDTICDFLETKVR
jgi:pimeloyl-ACP methyl ester carboxylesterase